MIISCAGKVTQLTLENTRQRCEISSKLTTRIPCVFIVNFDHIYTFFVAKNIANNYGSKTLNDF